MGLSTKQVSNDHHALDHWGQTLLESSGVGVDHAFPKPTPSRKQNQQQQQQQPEPLKCPRCGSMNTKFCYYNNYNKSQPRHFCKSCKRHWTKGGTLRNVPVGGGRKNKRLKMSSTNTTATTSVANSGPKNGAHHDLPPLASSNIGDLQTKNISDALCRVLMNNPTSISNDTINHLSGKSWISNNKNSAISGSVSPMISLPQDHQILQFSFSSLSPFDSIPSSFPSSNLSLGNNTYEYIGDQLDHLESTSTITTVTPATRPAPEAVSSQNSWQDPASGTAAAAEMLSYWNWNDADPFVSSDMINISWDEL